MNKQNKLGEMPMGQLVFSMSLPLMISLLVQSLYNIVDSIFVARLSERALTATSLAFPVQLLMIAVSVGTSVGINALLSRSIGAGEKDTTTNAADTGVLLSLIGMFVFLLLGLTCTGFFIRLFTDDEAIGADCAGYLQICMIFCGGTFIGTMYQRFLQSVGNTFDSMLTLIAGAVTNLILDPIMIFGLLGFPRLEIRGAAIATVIGQLVSAALAVFLNRRHNSSVQVNFKGFRFQAKILRQIYRVGLPTIVMQALGSIMVSAVNAILIRYSPTAVAFFGIYYKLQSFLFMPMHGMGQAAIPIVGFNYGAGKHERIRELFRVMLPAAVGIALLATLVFCIFPKTLLGFFSPSEEMLALGVPALRIIAPTFAFASITMILGYAVSGLGDGLVNMLGTAIRQFILLVPLIALFGYLWGIQAVWAAFWPAELCAMGYAVLASRRRMKEREI